MTFNYKILPIQKKTVDSAYEVKGFSETKRTVTRKWKKDRRKRRQDRRKCVRDGVFVNLSFRKSRRRGNDRRRIRAPQSFYV